MCRIFSRKPEEKMHLFLICDWLSVMYVINPKYNVCHLTRASRHSGHSSDIFGIKFEIIATYLLPIRLAVLGAGYLQRNGRGQEHLSKCQYSIESNEGELFNRSFVKTETLIKMAKPSFTSKMISLTVNFVEINWNVHVTRIIISKWFLLKNYISCKIRIQRLVLSP